MLKLCTNIGGLTLYQPMTHMCVMSSHKPIRKYMGGLIIGVNTVYRLFCFFKLIPMVGKGLNIYVLPMLYRCYGEVHPDEEDDQEEEEVESNDHQQRLLQHQHQLIVVVQLRQRKGWALNRTNRLDLVIRHACTCTVTHVAIVDVF